jgi:hypothetical protein
MRPVEKLLKHAGLGIDAGFHCGEVWSTEVLFQLSTATVLLLSFLWAHCWSSDLGLGRRWALCKESYQAFYILSSRRHQELLANIP